MYQDLFFTVYDRDMKMHISYLSFKAVGIRKYPTSLVDFDDAYIIEEKEEMNLIQTAVAGLMYEFCRTCIRLMLLSKTIQIALFYPYQTFQYDYCTFLNQYGLKNVFFA